MTPEDLKKPARQYLAEQLEKGIINQDLYDGAIADLEKLEKALVQSDELKKSK